MRLSDKALLQTLEHEVILQGKLLFSERKLNVGERANFRTKLKNLGGFVEKSIKEINRTIKELFNTIILLA